eukprot:Gb_19064 [translate_table: standard]
MIGKLFKRLEKFSKKGEKSKLKEKYWRIKLQCQELQEKIEAQNEELEEKCVKTALLQTQEVLRSQGLTSPANSPETRKDHGESLTLEIPIDSSFVFHDPVRRQTPRNLEDNLQDEIRALQREHQARKQESIELAHLLQILEWVDKRLEDAMGTLESVENKLAVVTTVHEQVKGKLRDSHRFTKILQGNLRNEKEQSAWLEKEVEDYKERLDAIEETISEMVGKEEKMLPAMRVKCRELRILDPKFC